MIQTNNYIDGRWVAGEDNIGNINPSDIREQGSYAAEFYTQVKTTYINT